MTRFATRLNSFAAQADRAWPNHSGKPRLEMMAQRAASVPCGKKRWTSPNVALMPLWRWVRR